MQMFEELNPFLEALKEELDGSKMEPGDEIPIVGKNCLVIFSMDDNRELKIHVIGGKPREIDAKLSIFEDDST